MKRLIPRKISQIIKVLDTTYDPDTLHLYEDALMVAFIESLLLLGSVSNLIVRLFWGDPLGEVLLVSFIMAFVGMGMDGLVRINHSKVIRDHGIGLLAILLIMSIGLDYYERIGLLVQAPVIAFYLLGMARMDKTLLKYVTVGAFALNAILLKLHPTTLFVFSPMHFVILFFVITICVLIGLTASHLYGKRFQKTIDQYLTVNQQHTELNQLYEEIIASEEALKVQNNQLTEYNERISANEKRLNEIAYFDTLTQLPNRKMLMEQLDVMVDLSSKSHGKFAVVFIDLDSFKKINDTKGHHIGDLFLEEVAKRLQSVIHKQDMLGRLGGDEFALIITKEMREDILLPYLESLLGSFNEPFLIHDLVFRGTASFGVALYPDDGKDGVELIKAADTAMYKAKELGKANIQFFQIEMKEEIIKKIGFENDLINAFKSKEFYLDYQPQFDINPKKLRGFEALVRWNSPKRGIVSPMEFIPLAEETGLIHGLGEWVIRTACMKAVELQKNFEGKLLMSINVSPVQMNKVGFVKKVEKILKECQIEGSLLEFEITESVFIGNPEKARETINGLKALNIRIALDDFGTGFSSLSYLTSLPIDTLKIDKSFVWGLDNQSKEKKIVGAIISLVHEMDIAVVAEGVETDSQLDYLHEKDCDMVQGFLLGKPLNDAQMLEIMRSNQLF